MPTTVEVNELPKRLAEVLVMAQGGTDVIITEGSEPKAKLVPLPQLPTGERILGLHPGAMVMTDDFDTPLPDEFWLGKS